MAGLRECFSQEVASDRRAAAETAYALAVRYRTVDVDGVRRFDLAKEWATIAIGLLDALPSVTAADVASGRQYVAGVAIPDLLHAGVVRARLGDVLV